MTSAQLQRREAPPADHPLHFKIVDVDVKVLEEARRPTRLVIIDFPSLETAKRSNESLEYRKVLPIRLQHAVSQILLVNGV